MQNFNATMAIKTKKWFERQKVAFMITCAVFALFLTQIYVQYKQISLYRSIIFIFKNV